MDKLNRRDFLRLSAISVAGAAVAACAQGTRADGHVRACASTDPHAAPDQHHHPHARADGHPGADPGRSQGIAQTADMVAGHAAPAGRAPAPEPAGHSMAWQAPGKYGGRMRVTHETWMGGNQEESMYGNSPLRWVDDGLGIDAGLGRRVGAQRRHLRVDVLRPQGAQVVGRRALYRGRHLVLVGGPGPQPGSGHQPAGRGASSGIGSRLRVHQGGRFHLQDDVRRALAVGRRPPGHVGERRHRPALDRAQALSGAVPPDVQQRRSRTTWSTTKRSSSARTRTARSLSHFKCDAVEDGVYVTWGRNHYYYCVDPDGNQLPYMDGCDDTCRAERRSAARRPSWPDRPTLRGTSQFGMPDVATLKANEGTDEHGDSVFWTAARAPARCSSSPRTIARTSTASCSATPRFQRALSHAWNRDADQKLVYFGTGELTTGTMSPKAIEYQFNDEAKERYVEWRDCVRGLRSRHGHGDAGRDRPEGHQRRRLARVPGWQRAADPL